MKSGLLKLFIVFLSWRLGLFLIGALAVALIPQFGAKFPYHGQVLENTRLPSWVWGFGNFDGVHYLRIAQDGYKADFSQAFFPVYPLLIKFLTEVNIFLPKDILLDTRIYVDPVYFINAFVLTQVIFFLAIFAVYKLFSMDFSRRTAFRATLLLIAFPSAFYFGSIYSESLFLLFVATSLYLVRKGKFMLAGAIAALAAGTRLIGVLLVIPLLIEGYVFIKQLPFRQRDWGLVKLYFALCTVVMGVLLYMFFLRMSTNDPLYFLHSQPFFGANRSVELVVNPLQVFYRYFKIFLSVPADSYAFFIAAVEFVFTVGTLVVVFVVRKRLRLSYLLFVLSLLILPILSGTLSSMPRYVLMAFPVLPVLVEIIKGRYIIVCLVFAVLQAVLLAIFIRGYWVA